MESSPYIVIKLKIRRNLTTQQHQTQQVATSKGYPKALKDFLWQS